MSDARLQISNLHFAYPVDGELSISVLDQVNIILQPNDFVSLIGPSGCGKSTLFNIIAGLLIPDAGTVTLDGLGIIGRPGSVAYMMQRDLLLPWRTVLENVTLGPEIAGAPRARTMEQARSLLQRFGLEGFEHAFPAALSGGMRQRAALLRTILCERSVILLDEPFGALDALTRSSMHEWLLGVQRDFQRTMILITHDPDEAVYLSNRVYVATERPMRIAGIINIDLPRERHHDDVTLTEAFISNKRDVLALLRSTPVALATNR